MYTRTADFLRDYREEAAAAQQNWDALTDESLAVKPGDVYWTLGEHLWHIASLWQYVFCNDLKHWPADELVEEAPTTAQGLADFYRQQAEKACAWIEANWSDADLAGELELWGMKMTRGQLLGGIIRHEAHHRGQIIVLMRLAGLAVHGIYGPGKEEVDALEQAQG